MVFGLVPPHTNSHFSILLEPGEHHLCANWQSAHENSLGTALLHFTAEAGKAYYFRASVVSVQYVGFLDFEAIESDQGKLLLALYPFSVSHPKNK
jgi:hypothetical protein